MPVQLKTSCFAYLLFVIVFSSCKENESALPTSARQVDTIPPLIHLVGKKIDTTYLQISSTSLTLKSASNCTWHPGNSTANYPDPGASVVDVIDGQLRCTDIPLTKTGAVNNKFPGTYILYYNAEDDAGNKAATVSRTVHVVQNSAAFLNGDYSIVTSYTATTKGFAQPTVSTSNYTANLSTSEKANNCLNLSALKIGTEYVAAKVHVMNDSFELSYYSPNFNTRFRVGSVSRANKTFTIETHDYHWDGSTIYTCKHVFTKVEPNNLITIAKKIKPNH